tara:strand:- start:1148 stop:2044 length:897 start_codon:yes stop_codon:yes gene_type:complete
MQHSEKVLVLGGTGLVGKALQEIKPDWTYVNSKDANLTYYIETYQLLMSYQPTAVVNLAARVGGIKDNAENQGEFFYDNVSMAMNVVECCRSLRIPRLLSALSTCAFPDKLDYYPMYEEDLHKGPPATTNFSYGYAKRMLQVMSKAYNKQYGVDYTCFSPANVYGPGDNFDTETSHFVPACIRKLSSDDKEVEFWGTGKPLRQQLYVGDLAKAIPILLDDHHTDKAIIVTPEANMSIREMVDVVKKVTGSTASISYNGKLDGQFRKDGSNSLFMELAPNFTFTPFEEGVRKTYEWYKS